MLKQERVNMTTLKHHRHSPAGQSSRNTVLSRFCRARASFACSRLPLAFLFLTVLLAGNLRAFAQEGQPPEKKPVPLHGPRQRGPGAPPPGGQERPGRFQPPDPSFQFMFSEPRFGGKTVKGAPYSAVIETEMVQTLGDGSKITRKTTGQAFRDSEGRTRREQTLQNIGPFTDIKTNGGVPPVTVFINDPVANVNFMLDPQRRTARKMTFRTGGPPPPPQQSMKRETPEAKTESLGKQTIEGVEAEGTRTTVTIPAGQIGNDRALEIVSERWYSAALQEVVLSKYRDPRFGEHTYRLKNINRAEPAHNLFEAPSDYTVSEDRPFDGRGRRGERRPEDK